MVEPQQPALSYHENLIDQLGRPLITDCPAVYEPNAALIERVNRGEFVSQTTAFEQYFSKLQAGDAEYMKQVDRMVQARGTHLPGSVDTSRRLQFVVPAYREGENIGTFLSAVKKQGEATPTTDWGVTFVIDHAVPYKNLRETSAVQRMRNEITSFIEQNPEYAGRVDSIVYARRAETTTPILPVGLARKVGEDVIMYERLLAAQRGEETTTPLYLSQIDIDSSTLTPGLFAEIMEELPTEEADSPAIVRVRGSFDREDVKANPHLHPLQMMWEGATSQVGEHTKHNPFTIGRFSVIPARELAITGGGFAKKLPFPDEDIRKGIQIGWNLDNVDVVEVEGKYSTSARRELVMMNTLMQMSRETGGDFNLATLKCAALIDMYGDWAKHTYRKDLGNVTVYDTKDAFMNSEYFNAPLPPVLIEQMANAFYRFTTFSMFAVDALADHPQAQEVQGLKNRFLKGEIPYFQVQLDTMTFIYDLARSDPQRFEKLKKLLAHIDRNAQQAVSNILTDNQVDFTLQDHEVPFYGIQEGRLKRRPDDGKQTDEEQRADKSPLRIRFKITSDQTSYMDAIRQELEQTA